MAPAYAKDQLQGFTNRVEKVAIVGATGQMGRHLTEQMVKTGKHAVTVITRPGNTKAVPAGVRVVHVDYGNDDNSALVEALRGHQALLITMAVTAPRDTTPKLLRAAAEAGVSYVLPNWFGHDAAHDSLCQDSMLVPMRDAVLSEMKNLSPMSYFLLCCGFWYEFSLAGGIDRFGVDFQKRAFIRYDDGATPINVSTWPQCGRAMAHLLSLKRLPEDETDRSPTMLQFCNGPVYISSFRLTQNDIFESVKRVTRTADADWTITQESAEQRFKEGDAEVKKGNFAAFPKRLYSRFFFANGGGDHESSRGVYNEALSLPDEDLDEWTAVAARMSENGEVAHSH